MTVDNGTVEIRLTDYLHAIYVMDLALRTNILVMAIIPTGRSPCKQRAASCLTQKAAL